MIRRGLKRAALVGLAALVALAGLLAVPAPAAAATPAPELGTDAQRAAGQKIYTKWCAQCHGDAGDGQGIAAPTLRPAPRDFTSGKYKVRATPSGSLPTDADVKRSIKLGLPYTGMPAFEQFSDEELSALVYYLKSFSADFADPERYLEPLELPKPPPYSAAAEEEGRAAYQELGCAACHGETGRGNGPSAPSQRDDWGHPIRPADLTKPWAFRGGATRADVFRAIATGFNGTPMAGFWGAVPPEKLWKVVDYIVSLSGNVGEAPYGNVVAAVGIDDDLDLERGAELFAAAPPTLIPLIGQIMEPGRDFHPATNAVEVRAVFNEKEIAFLVSWHDMRAETAGRNAPDLEVPTAEERPAAGGGSAAEDAGGGGFWGDEVADDVHGGGGGGEDAGAGDDFWGEAAPTPAPAPPADEGGGFWDEGSAAPAAATADTEFSDAIGIQLPQTLPDGVVQPYFLFGDAQNPVDLWYADLGAAAGGEGKLYTGRGAAALTPGDGDSPTVHAVYTADGWAVAFKRARLPRSGVGFVEDAFVPAAFTVWDGFERERGNRRALSAWQYVYVQPRERPSPVGPIAKAGLAVLALELLVIGWVRRRKSRNEPHRGGAVPAPPVTTQ